MHEWMNGEMAKSNGLHQRKISIFFFFFFKLLMNKQGLKCLSYFGKTMEKNYQKKLNLNDDYHW